MVYEKKEVYKGNEAYDLVKEIRKNVEVVDSTFEKNGLEVISVGIDPEDDGEFNFILELNKKNHIELEDNLWIIINCYDDENGIIYTDKLLIWSNDYDKLSGSCVLTSRCSRKKLLSNIKKIKLFVL